MITILFCEADPRIIQAAHTLKQTTEITPVLVGDAAKYSDVAASQTHLEDIEIIPINAQLYAKQYYERRKHKGISEEEALTQCQDPATFCCMHLLNEQADALICGATWPTGDTLRPALQLLKKGLASSYFEMRTDKGLYYFGDCALNVQPDAQELANIAINTATAAQKHGLTPKIAMLSFSTMGSAQHPDQQKVAQATMKVAEHITENTLNWKVSGEMQVDAAMDSVVAHHKAPQADVQGDANIFIFPDLDAGNIGYKLVQRFTGCKAIGPLITGLKKEVNDLSRGCSAEEIVEIAKISAWNASQ